MRAPCYEVVQLAFNGPLGRTFDWQSNQKLLQASLAKVLRRLDLQSEPSKKVGNMCSAQCCPLSMSDVWGMCKATGAGGVVTTLGHAFFFVLRSRSPGSECRILPLDHSAGSSVSIFSRPFPKAASAQQAPRCAGLRRPAGAAPHRPVPDLLRSLGCIRKSPFRHQEALYNAKVYKRCIHNKTNNASQPVQVHKLEMRGLHDKKPQRSMRLGSDSLPGLD